MIDVGVVRAAAIDHLTDRPKLVISLVRVLMVAALVTVLSASLYLQGAFDNLRSTTNGTVAKILAVRQLEFSLRTALAEERGARLATTAASLADARSRFEAAARDASVELGEVIRTATAPGVGLHQAIDALSVSVSPALSALRRLIPDRPGSRGAGDIDDRMWLGPPLGWAGEVTRLGIAARRRDVRAIQRHERLDIAGSVGGLTLFVVLLGGAATRLIEGRERTVAARRSAIHQAQLLTGVINHMPDGVAVFDAEDRLIICNARLAPVAGLPPALTTLAMPLEVMADALAHAEPPLLAAPRPSIGVPVAGEMRVGERVLAVWRTAIATGGQMLTISDVTERVAAEEVARRTQRLEVLGRLTGGVAHDFNNLLQALSANLDVMASETERSPRLQQLTADALAAVERGLRLTRHLLAFARRQELAPVSLDVGAVLTGLSDLLSRTLGDTIEVTLAVEPDLWPALSDRAGLENALLNLALNARDAMPKGGVLSIAARNHAAADTDHVSIRVLDQGIGMTREQLARAIEPFYTTKTIGSGVGLGLSLVDGFARQSGGQFRLRSELGRGTEAVLELPRASAPPAVDPAVGRPEPGRGELVLLVEDDPAVAAATQAALQSLGYRVVEASDVEAACRRLGNGLSPDLIFTDVMMPGPLDVADLTRRARALRPDLPIVFNTGDVEARVLSSIAFDERMRLIAKPWRMADLSREIRALLDPPPALALQKGA